ncbi:MAG: hypothetical protein M1817_004304 [Caeruleum heppii]|nr:MAG: hypothetical protein M1817_004304 [Caeruleum heppii]
MSTPTILVTGATGNQGRGVTKHLLRNHCAVHAFVRDATSKASRALAAQGAILFEGTWDDVPALTAAAQTCTGLFLNVNPSFTDDAELRHARNILGAAKTAGVQHVIYSSATGIGRQEEIPGWNPKSLIAGYFLSKQTVEEEVRRKNSGWSTWTILHPGYFMTNFLLPSAGFMFPDLATKGTCLSVYPADTKLPLINPEAVGQFATAAFLDPHRFGGQIIDVVAETMEFATGMEMLGRAAGRKIEVTYRSTADLEASVEKDPLAASGIIVRELSRFVDLERTKGWGVEMQSFEAFLGEHREAVEASVGGEGVEGGKF